MQILQNTEESDIQNASVPHSLIRDVQPVFGFDPSDSY